MRDKGSGRSRAAGAIAALGAAILLSVALGASATTAQSLDGTYKGTYSGSASGEVEFIVSGSDVTVSKPGSGSGSVSGSTITTVVGNATVNGQSCEYQSTGELSAGSASGTWNANCGGGVTGSGSWEATRPAPTASPSPSLTPGSSPTPSARTLSLKAKPKGLSAPGRTTLTATLSACTEQSSIDFQVRSRGEFNTTTTVETGDDCNASIKRRVGRTTTFRAQSPADGPFAAAQSRTVTVRLER